MKMRPFSYYEIVNDFFILCCEGLGLYFILRFPQLYEGYDFNVAHALHYKEILLYYLLHL